MSGKIALNTNRPGISTQPIYGFVVSTHTTLNHSSGKVIRKSPQVMVKSPDTPISLNHSMVSMWLSNTEAGASTLPEFTSPTV